MNSSVDFDLNMTADDVRMLSQVSQTRGDINTIDHTEHERSEEDGHEEDEHGIADNIQESVVLSDEDESSPLNQPLSSNTSICTNTGLSNHINCERTFEEGGGIGPQLTTSGSDPLPPSVAIHLSRSSR